MSGTIFLQACTIDLKKIPIYKEFEGEFIEPIDYKLCHMILANDPLLCQDSGGKELTATMIANFRNNVVCGLNKNGLLSVKHFQSINKLGRYYAIDYRSLISHARIIKHTIMHYMGWIDLDMVKGHPSIAIAVFGVKSLPAMEEYVNTFDTKVAELSTFYAVEEGGGAAGQG
jgi:hypothetical protein